MNEDPTVMVKAETSELIRARLRLAQALLEESDALEGRDGYDLDHWERGFHPRHEREALVTYLLLTCFDCLGQKSQFTTLPDWLKSKKEHHVIERNRVLESLQPNATHLEAACTLADRYQSLYGVTNAFYQGVNNLPEKARQLLLSSVVVSICPEFGMHGPNVSTPSYPIEDEELALSLKLKHLYQRRNRFTHSLEQLVSLSTPALSEHCGTNGSSWAAEIRDARLTYWGIDTEYVRLKTGGVHVLSVKEWPFVLFEVLYSTIGVAFERTSIKLRFQVRFFNSAEPSRVVTLNGVEHEHLKDVRTLEHYVWTEHSIPSK